MLGFFQCSPSRCGRLKVTGDPNPDCTGDYVEGGTYEGYPYYGRVDGNYFIWRKPADAAWKITQWVGGWGSLYWHREQNVLGTYTPKLDARGNPIVENA